MQYQTIRFPSYQFIAHGVAVMLRSFHAHQTIQATKSQTLYFIYYLLEAIADVLARSLKSIFFIKKFFLKAVFF